MSTAGRWPATADAAASAGTERLGSEQARRTSRRLSAKAGRSRFCSARNRLPKGLNLQTCGVLINYEMPWNPMRVEQRIGRIDRIGQEYDRVWIRNYFYDGTVEATVYQRLDDRIASFESVVGELQPILSQVAQSHRSRRDGQRQAARRIDRQGDRGNQPSGPFCGNLVTRSQRSSPTTTWNRCRKSRPRSRCRIGDERLPNPRRWGSD